MKTYEYEIVVGRKVDDEGTEVRKAQRIAHDSGLLEMPTEKGLLVKHAKDILDANATGDEVSINIRPFCA